MTVRPSVDRQSLSTVPLKSCGILCGMGVYRQRNEDGTLKSHIWYMKFQVRGVKVHAPTGKTAKAEALNVEATERLKLDKETREAVQSEARRMSRIPALGDFLRDEFLPYSDDRFEEKPKTRAYYRYGAEILMQCLGHKPIDEITDRNAREIEAGLVLKGKPEERNQRVRRPEKSTVNCALRTLRRTLNLAHEWGMIPQKPVIRLAKGENARTLALSEQASESYLKACEQPWRDAATVILYTGARPEEVRKARWEDIEWRKRGGIIYVQKGKTPSARRPLPMLPPVYKALLARHKAQGRPTAGWVFPSEKNPERHWDQGSQKNWHRRAIMASGLAPFPPYTLRHTGLTRIAPYCDAFTLARIAGHSSIAMTAKYVHPQQGAIEQAFSRFSRSVRVERQSL